MSSASQPLTTTEQNKLLVNRWFDEVWNRSRRETIFKFLPESAILELQNYSHHFSRRR